MSETLQEVSLYDNRPFFEVALRYGMKHAILTRAKIEAIEVEAPKGLVQIAEAFGSKYLRSEIETARKRIVNLASLYLVETSRGDIEVAAKLIRDNTFLTLSRGGSGLLKAVYAMPEYALLGKENKDRIEEFLDVWSLKDKPQEYRNLFLHRQNNAIEIEAGFWFGQSMDLTQTELLEEDVEAVTIIRTAILKRLIDDGDAPIENQIEFATLIEGLRKEYKSKSRKAKLLDFDTAKLHILHDDIPSKFHVLVSQILNEIVERDIPQILDKKNSLARLVFELKERYFICSHEMEDTSDYDALVSKEWSKVTKGKTNIDSLLTLFLCIAIDLPMRTSLAEKNAKSLVKKMREHGWDTAKPVDWIKANAPHEKQEGLLLDWQSFVEDAEVYLLDDWDANCSGAIRFLSENCQIEKAPKKEGL